jgi:hypothetical protein
MFLAMYKSAYFTFIIINMQFVCLLLRLAALLYLNLTVYKRKDVKPTDAVTAQCSLYWLVINILFQIILSL